jgi:hypothetical protein
MVSQNKDRRSRSYNKNDYATSGSEQIQWKNDQEFGNNSWKMLSVRGVIPVFIIIQPEFSLDFKEKKKIMDLLF